MDNQIKWVKVHGTDEKQNTTIYVRHDAKTLGEWYKNVQRALKEHDISPWFETCVIIDEDNDNMCEALKVKVAEQKADQTKELLEEYLNTL